MTGDNFPSVLAEVCKEAQGRPADRPFNWIEFHVMVSEVWSNSARIRVAGRVGPGARNPLLPDAARFFGYLKNDLRVAGIPWEETLETWPPLRVITFEGPD